MKIKVLQVLLGFCAFCAQGISQADYDSTWNHTIEVSTGEQDFSGTKYHAYSTMVYETSKSTIKDLVADEVASYTGEKVKGKNVVEGEDVSLKAFNGKMVSVVAKTENVKKVDDAILVSVAFLSEGEAVSPQTSPDLDKSAKQVMHNIGVKLNKSVVAAQIDDVQKELDELKRKSEIVTKQYTGIQDDITKTEAKIRDLEVDKAKAESKMTAAQAQSASLEAMSKGSSAQPNDLKKYAKAKDKAIGLEDKYLKYEENIAKAKGKLSESNIDLQEKKVEVDKYNQEVAKYTRLRQALDRKYDAIN